jgi:branched-chain amino acid transport system substrate-binding protein
LSNPNLDAARVVKNSIFQDKAQAALLFPDVPYTPKAYEIIKANAQLMSDPNNQQKRGLKLLGGDTLYYSATLNETGAAGLVLAVPRFETASQSQAFFNLARQLWGGQVEITPYTASSFDAAQALIATLSANASRATVLPKLRQVNLPPSQTSGESLQFTQQGEPNIQPILVRVVGGQFQLVER